MSLEFDKLDSWLDEPALKKETDFFLSLIDEIEKKAGGLGDIFKNVSIKIDAKDTGIKEMIDGVKKLELTSSNYQKVLTAIATEVDNLSESQKNNLKVISDTYKEQEKARSGAKETVNLIKTEIAQTEKLEAGRTALAKTIALNSAQLKSEKLERDRLSKVINAENNSLEKSQAVIDLLINKKKKLNLETEQGRRVNEAFNKAIEKERDFILKNADAETKRIKNIGNYQGSAKIIVDALERARSKATQTVKAFGELSPEAQAATREFEGLKRITDQPQFLNIAAKLGDSNAELKFFVKQLNQLEDSGLKNSAVYKDVQARLAQLTDQIGDTRAEVKALSSDSRGFDLFAGSVSFVADGFELAAGAAALFGANEKKVEEVTKNLVAIQSISNGVKGIANELTTKGTSANKVFAFTQNLVTTALDSSAAASKRLYAALGLIGLIATVIGGIVVAIGEMTKETTAAEKAQKALKDVISEAAGEYGKAKVQVQSLTDKIALAKAGYIDKKEVLKEYNETVGKTIGTTDDLNVAEQNLIAKGPAYVAYMFAKAQAAGAYALAAKKAEEAVKNEAATTEELTGFFDKVKASFKSITFKSLFVTDTKQLVDANKKLTEIGEQNRAKNAANLKTEYDTFLSIGEQKTKEADEKFKENNFINAATGTTENQKKGRKEKITKAVKDASKDIDIAYELFKIRKEREKSQLEEVINDETESFRVRYQALLEFYKVSNDLINAEQKRELQNLKNSGKNKELVDEETIDKRISLQKGYVEKLKGIRKEEAALEPKGLQQRNSPDVQQDDLDGLVNSLNQIEAQKERAKEILKEVESAIIDVTKQLVTNSFNNKIAEFDSLIAKNNELRDAEIDRINKSSLSESEKADKIALLNARTEAQNNELEKKRRKAEIDKARFEKGVAIFQLTLELAKAIASLNVPKIVATSAQLAVAIATPLPKFKDGKKLSNTYEGPGIWGEAGQREVKVSKDGTVEVSPLGASLTYVKKDDVIHPSIDDYVKTLQISAMGDVMRSATPTHKQEDVYSKIMAQKLEENILQSKQSNELLKTIANKKELNLTAKQGGMEALWKYAASQIKYVNENCDW